MLMIERALELAAVAHDYQYRKGTNIPYISHPFAVGMLLMNNGCSQEVIVAGILHDTVEDTDLTLEEIRSEFGDSIAGMVAGVTEMDKSLPWEERKQLAIDDLKTASRDVCMIVLADKIHNLRSIKRDLELFGERAWNRFKRGRNKQEWYYRGIGKVLKTKVKNTEPLFKEYNEVIEQVFS